MRSSTLLQLGVCLLLLTASTSQATTAAFAAESMKGDARPDPAPTARAEIALSPTISSRLSSVERWWLNVALTTARERLSEEPCRALFDGLALEPTIALDGTIYEPASPALARAFCNSGVVALTVVNGQRTRLCASFGHLSRWDMAATLIHEAMHRAGQRESPPHAGAPTSREIAARVREACDL